MYIFEILLDTLFWQYLGKALRWGIDEDGNVYGRDGFINVWQSYWHDFIDHLAEGKDIDVFFDELIEEIK